MSAVAEARNRLKMVADGAQVGSTAKAWTAFRSDLSLILALPDREALAEMIRASVSQTCGINCEAMITASDERENELDAADRILSHLKGESSND